MFYNIEVYDTINIKNKFQMEIMIKHIWTTEITLTLLIILSNLITTLKLFL
jgi:hypothetical protein